MHYLDPAAPDNAPESRAADDAPRDTSLHAVLTQYEQYLADGGSHGFTEWARKNELISASCTTPMPLPVCLYKRGAHRSRTPIQDIVAHDRYSARDKQMIFEVNAALHAMDSSTDEPFVVVAEPRIPPRSRRRLNFPDKEAPANEPPPAAVAMDESGPSAPRAADSLAARIRARLDAGAFELNISYHMCRELEPEAFDTESEYASALMCELVMFGALYGIPLAPSTFEVTHAASGRSAHASRQREWEARRFLAAALARCPKTRGMVCIRDVAACVASLRPPFAVAVVAHVFAGAGSSDSAALAWTAAAHQYASLRPSWTTADIHPARKDFTPPYMTYEVLRDAAALASQYIRMTGMDMTYREAEMFEQVLAYAVAVCTEFDPVSLGSARRADKVIVESRDGKHYAALWHKIATYARANRDNLDSHVTADAAYWAIAFVDAHGRPAQTDAPRHGPMWYCFVRVTAVLEAMVARSVPLLFQQNLESQLLHPLPANPPSLYGLERETAASVCEAVRKFDKLVDEFAFLGVQTPEARATVAQVGTFLCAVCEALRLARGKVDTSSGVIDAQLHMKAILCCVRSVYTQCGNVHITKFVQAVVYDIYGHQLAGVLAGVWDVWLPRFAECALVQAARAAVDSPYFDERAAVEEIADESPMARLLRQT